MSIVTEVDFAQSSLRASLGADVVLTEAEPRSGLLSTIHGADRVSGRLQRTP